MGTIEYLAKMIAGDNPLMPYRSGPKLVTFYNKHGSNEIYPTSGFPSRWFFSQEQLKLHNGKASMFAIIEDAFDPLHFGDLDVASAVSEINHFLQRDQLQVVLSNGKAAVCDLVGASVNFTPSTMVVREASFDSIRRNISKCESKLQTADYDGAITNARSLIEDVLREIERDLNPSTPEKYDGDLPRLYKRVRKLLNMDPEKYFGRDDVIQLLTGLTSVVDGLASLSNAMADRHGGHHEIADARHARLAVNAANTLCGFVVDVYENLLSKDASA